MFSFGGGKYLVYLTCMSAVMILNLFSMDERSGWLKYVMVMPTTKKQYVYAKYVMSLLFVIAGFVVALLCYVVTEKAGVVKRMSLDEVKVYTLTALFTGILLCTVYIPAIIKFGIDRSKFVIVGIAASVFAVFYLLSRSMDRVPSQIVYVGKLFGGAIEKNSFLLLVIGLLLYMISMLLSVCIIEAKELA